MKEILSNKEINDISEKQFTQWIKNILNELKKDTKVYIFFSNALKNYKGKKYKDFNYKKIQNIFLKSWKQLWWWKWIIEDKLMPTIDFQYNEEIILRDINKFIKNNKNYNDCIIWIAKYLKDHIQYQFFLWFSQLLNNLNKENIKILYNTKITKHEINFLIEELWWINYIDKYMNKFIKILKSWDTNNIKEYLIKDFNNFSEDNKKLLYATFSWLAQDKWINLYSYTNNTSAYDILYKYNSWDCKTISIIAKQIFNKIYKWKSIKMLHVLNYWIGHSYNLILIKKENRIKFEYLDFIEYIRTWNIKDIKVKYIKKYEIFWKNHISNNNIKLV